jgi:hypothetical protein
VVSLATSPDADGRIFYSMMDVTGDGTPDLMARDDDGRLAIFSLKPRGAVRIEVELEVAPREGADVDGDGHLDLLGRVRVDDDDPIKPDFVDVATWSGAKLSNKTDAAKAFHARERDARPVPEEPMEPAPKLKRALERAWHAVLAGGDRDKVMKALDEEKPAPKLAGAFAVHRLRIDKISR